jgi:hypothetical protein
MKSVVLVILALLAVRLGGQPQSTTDNLCSIEGQVVRAVTGEPLKSARLSLVQVAAPDKPRSYKAVSDDKGRFQLTGVAPGRYRFVATGNGTSPSPISRKVLPDRGRFWNSSRARR